MGELQRILANGNHKFIDEVKKKWEDFCTKVQFYGVWKKAMKPPMTLDASKSFVTNTLSSCFHSCGTNNNYALQSDKISQCY